MKSVSAKFLALMCGLLFMYSLANADTNTSTPSLAPMLKNVMPVVVNINAQLKITDLATLNRLQQEQQAQTPNNGSTQQQQAVPDQVLSIGSGVIVDAAKGYILTNAHVVQDAQQIIVTLSNRHRYIAKIVGLDRPSDIALLKIDAKNLTAITMGNSSDLKVGDTIVAIGNPYGLSQTVTSGIVSALGRSTLGIETFENFIQISAPINPGNSGGALVNTKGELVGLNTAILAPDRGNIGIGFAIPSNLLQSVIAQLTKFGNVKRGMLGVGAQDVTPDLASAFGLQNDAGAVVTLVMPNSPAALAGLQVGDIITAINDTTISSANDVVNAVGFARVDSAATVSILRDGKKITLTTKLTDAKVREQLSEKQDPFLYGLALKPNFTLSSPLQGDIDGLLVVDVQQDSDAWRADLRPGDVIIAAGQPANTLGSTFGDKQQTMQAVHSVSDLRKIASATSGGNLLLNILRANGALFLVIKKEGL